MRIERRDGTGERSVLTGMVVSKAVLGPIAARWSGDMFGSRWANLIAGWAVDHHKRYKTAPGDRITDYFDRWAVGNKDKETIGLVEDYLTGISDEYERLKKSTSPDYVLDQAEVLFNRVRAKNLKEDLEQHLTAGDVAAATAAINDFRRVEISASSGINVTDTEEEFVNAFQITSEPLVVYPDALMGFFGHVFARDCFVSFMGKEKVGKSYWLLDLAFRAFTQDRKVAYFEVGDMSQHQVLKRVAARATERPVKADRWFVPTSITPSDEGEGRRPQTGTKREEADRDMTPQEAFAAVQKLGVRHGKENFKLSCHPNSSISVNGIESILDGWRRDRDWVPDVVVIDYADILAPIVQTKEETREQINSTWKAMRALSQRWHCLVVTATQTDADSYDAEILTRSNFSEDKRKYAHVTATVGINQDDDDKQNNLYRLNLVLAREMEFSEKQVVWTAACLAIGNPCVLSTF